MGGKAPSALGKGRLGAIKPGPRRCDPPRRWTLSSLWEGLQGQRCLLWKWSIQTPPQGPLRATKPLKRLWRHPQLHVAIPLHASSPRERLTHYQLVQARLGAVVRQTLSQTCLVPQPHSGHYPLTPSLQKSGHLIREWCLRPSPSQFSTLPCLRGQNQR